MTMSATPKVPQPKEKSVEELTPAVPSGREQRTYARRNQAPNRLTIIEQPHDKRCQDPR
jgi:hypothetical protein